MCYGPGAKREVALGVWGVGCGVGGWGVDGVVGWGGNGVVGVVGASRDVTEGIAASLGNSGPSVRASRSEE